MRTLPKQDAYRTDPGADTRRRESDDGVPAAPGETVTSHPKPREEGDDFTVLLHLGLV